MSTPGPVALHARRLASAASVPTWSSVARSSLAVPASDSAASKANAAPRAGISGPAMVAARVRSVSVSARRISRRVPTAQAPHTRSQIAAKAHMGKEGSDGTPMTLLPAEAGQND